MATSVKRGAGLLFCCGEDCLLLLRTSVHNNNTWGLPGGNVDAGDADLAAAARREAEEEMGPLPAFQIRGQVLTRRGKLGEKHYTVFVAEVTPEARATWQPQLNHEHSAWRWFPVAKAAALPDLHPVSALLLQSPQHRQQVAALGLALPPLSHAAATAGGTGGAKRGAGLLLCAGDECLLLLRTSVHNNNTWGLPGGNVDASDADLAAAARREAEEEMGPLPPYEVKAAIETRRGKLGEKHYTVFVAAVSAEARASWQPQLNHEHSAWRWFRVAEAAARPDLHPVPSLLFSHPQHHATLLAALGP